jgi:hypothetical protein
MLCAESRLCHPKPAIDRASKAKATTEKRETLSHFATSSAAHSAHCSRFFIVSVFCFSRAHQQWNACKKKKRVLNALT